VRQAERALERLERVEKPFEPWRLQLSLTPRSRSGDVVVRLEDAVVELGSFQLGPIDLDLRYGDRLAVTGSNGSGKTTLLRALLTSRLQPAAASSGRASPSATSTSAGSASTPAGCSSSSSPPRPSGEPRRREPCIAKFGLSADDVRRPGASLSPGERTRAALALTAARGVNCLILDEPTNHLDLPAIEELETALATFAGTVVLVTHDRRLLGRFEPTRELALPFG